ncbi:hypothetical protein E2P81_ATG01978 [Venturia nashicola]|nr:hypothetical protein E2P81_ATG01978 [Venturia nashicola]
MSDATTISNDDFAARIAFVQQDLRRELGGMEARAEHSNDRVQIAMAALDEAIVEEQEQRRSSTKLDEAQRSSTKLNEAQRRYEEMKTRRQKRKKDLEIVLEKITAFENEKSAGRSMIQQNEASLKSVFDTLLKSPAKTSGKERVQNSRIDGTSAGTRNTKEVAPRKVTPPPLPPSAPTTPLSRNTMVDGADTNPGLMDAMIDNASPRRKMKLFTTAKCPKRGEAVSSGVYSADKKAAMEAHNVSVGESVIDVRHLRDVNYAVDWVPKCAMPVLAPIPMVAMHQIHRPD